MLKKLTNNVYYTEPDESTDRPTMGYVKGNKYSLMVEAGNSAKTVHKFNSSLSELGFPKADFAVVTHSHWDHTFGLHSLEAVSIALDKTNDILKFMENLTWSDSLLEKYVSEDIIPLFCKPHIINEYKDLSEIVVKPADISFTDEMTLDLGNQKCVFKNIVSPHTDDCVIVYIPGENCVFLGDCLCEELVGDQWIDNKEKLAVLIETLENLDFEYGLEGHFAPRKKEDILKDLKVRLNL